MSKKSPAEAGPVSEEMSRVLLLLTGFSLWPPCSPGLFDPATAAARASGSISACCLPPPLVLLAALVLLADFLVLVALSSDCSWKSLSDLVGEAWVNGPCAWTFHTRQRLDSPRVPYDGTKRRSRKLIDWSSYAARGTKRTAITSHTMDITTILIIVVLVLLLGGGGWYGRGRWYGR